MIGIMAKRLGPYHEARLAAVQARAPVTALEIVHHDVTYDWRIRSDGKTFPVVALFEREDEIRADEVRARVHEVLDHAAPDVMCIPGWASVTALWALDWCLKKGIPAVLFSDSTAWDSPRSAWRELPKSLIVRLFSAAVVAGTPHAAYVRSLGMPEPLIFSGYDVVDNRYFSGEAQRIRADAVAWRARFALPDGYLLASARFVAKKNILGLLAAYAAYVALAPTHPWSLVLLGSGELAGEIQKKIVEYGIKDRVILPGFIQYEDLPAYYALASAFVHASTTEQWGLVVNEAMASGLPVLVSERCGCAEDLVENGVNGFTFAPGDTAALAALMHRVAAGTLDLAAMGEAGRKRIAAWSPERFAGSVLDAAAAAATRAKSRRWRSSLRPLLHGAIALRQRAADVERSSRSG